MFILVNPNNPRLPVNINTFREYNTINEEFWKLVFRNLDETSQIKLYAELDDPKEKRALIIKPRTKFIRYQEGPENVELAEIGVGQSSSSPSIDGLILEYSAEGENAQKFDSEIYSAEFGLQVKFSTNYKEHLHGLFFNTYTTVGDVGKKEFSRRFSNIQVKKMMDRIVKILRRIEPSLNSLSLGSDGIIYCDIGLDRLVPLNIMGGGMIKILGIITGMLDSQDGIVLIDEIENGLYYTSQEVLWDAIFESAEEFNVQVFATTHSIECIKAFSNSYSRSRLSQGNDRMQLFRVERENNITRVIDYNTSVLKAALDSDWEVR